MMGLKERVLGHTRVDEAVMLAFAAIRAAKLRAALTILGVVLGVSTVMAMASIVQGMRDQIVKTIEVAGPTTFYVMKVFSQQPLNPDALPRWVRVRPNLEEAEAERIATLPEVHYASMWAQVFGRVEYQGIRTGIAVINGADDRLTEVLGGELARGRWFTRAEMSSGASVVVLDESYARRVFGEIDPIDKVARIGGVPARVVGLYTPAKNIFQPPGQDNAAFVPYRMLDRHYHIDRTNALFIAVKPRAGVSVAEAQGAVTVVLREMRRLRPGIPNSFDMITQDQILQVFNRITGVFFLVMIVLSAVGLLVGGIGVMAVMMISVTERTREIGVRKALGATRRDILMQFLIEACTLTGLGGLLGVVAGLAVGRLGTAALGVTASPPLNLTLIAVGVSVGIGIVFGMLPARRAARLDPIEALRYE